jgi:hypothetical protein
MYVVTVLPQITSFLTSFAPQTKYIKPVAQIRTYDADEYELYNNQL